ncbi:MAG: mannitol dehydrogenase family protein [Paraglaciecola sp.]|nr:mannitol dehydrogenase family protein [Paraglaciecola sp.]
MQPLNHHTIASLPADVSRRHDSPSKQIGIVHIGPGAFHRAHQAVFTEDALPFDDKWGICAVSMHSRGVRDELSSQDNLYTLAILDHAPRFQIISAIREVLVLADQRQQVMARLTAATTHIVTLTITEKGYCLDAQGQLDFQHADIRHDLAKPEQPMSAIGLLVAALRERYAKALKQLTIISCDNVSDNGNKLAKAVISFAAEQDRQFADWIEQTIYFPNTMVDSITPATDDALRQRVNQALKVHDNWPIQREAFSQWVIEDRFSGPLPQWEKVGVTFTHDVSAYEKAKLRVLNGSHSTLAYLGLRCGLVAVSQAVNQPVLLRFLRQMLKDEVQGTLNAPSELNISQYIDAVLTRFRNPHIRHLLSQIAWDGSQKLPIRLLGTIQDNLDKGTSIRLLSAGIAAWLQFLVSAAKTQTTLVDPLAETLLAVATKCTGNRKQDVELFLAISSVFPTKLAKNPAFMQAVSEAYISLFELNEHTIVTVIDSFLN